ncbi:MAG: hypothetical protein P8178_05070 [Candidatus Thiodiazotropha sp.]
MNRTRIRRSLACFVSTLLWCAATQAQVELEFPDQGFYRPGDPLTFKVPSDMPIEVLQRLSMELDGIDVTSFVSREGDRAIYTPPQPLAYGPHEIRLVEYLPDGNIVERALFKVEVRKNALFRQADAVANVSLSATQRIYDDNASGSVAKGQQQGGANLSARVADGEWQAGADMDLIYLSQPELTADGRRLDMARGLVSATRGPVTVQAGDQAIPGANLVLNGFARRGVSGSVRLDGLRSEFTGFAMRTAAINGFPHWPGVSDSGSRTDGVLWTTTPLAQHPERLQITATYLNGEGSPDGSSVAGVDEPVSNDAGSFVVDSLTWEQRLRLRGEYARSTTDFDASAPLLGDTSDHALDLLATYQQPQSQLGDAAFYWNLGAEHKRIGLDFYSLGNVGQPTDKLLNQVFGGFNWGGWAMNGQLARQRDNIDNDPRFPHLNTDIVALSTSYSPLDMPELTGFMRLFAQPSLSVTAQHWTRRHQDIPVAYAGDRLDDATDVVTAMLQFVPGNWSWDIVQTHTSFRDHANIQPDSLDDYTDLGLNLPLTQNLTLGTRLQYDHFNDQTHDTLTETIGAQANLGISAMENRLNASLAYTLNRNMADDGSVDTTNYTIDAAASWIATQVRPNRPGLTLFTQGSYQDDQDLLQIFAGLRVDWQAIY